MDAVPPSPTADDERMVSDAAYSIAAARIFLRETRANFLKELRVAIPGPRVGLVAACRGLVEPNPVRAKPFAILASGTACVDARPCRMLSGWWRPSRNDRTRRYDGRRLSGWLHLSFRRGRPIRSKNICCSGSAIHPVPGTRKTAAVLVPVHLRAVVPDACGCLFRAPKQGVTRLRRNGSAIPRRVPSQHSPIQWRGSCRCGKRRQPVRHGVSTAPTMGGLARSPSVCGRMAVPLKFHRPGLWRQTGGASCRHVGASEPGGRSRPARIPTRCFCERLRSATHPRCA